MMQPARTKFRKAHKGRIHGLAKGGYTLNFGAYGLKSVDSLWTRLILDLNRAQDVVLYTIGQIQDLVAGFRAIFSGGCT